MDTSFLKTLFTDELIDYYNKSGQLTEEQLIKLKGTYDFLMETRKKHSYDVTFPRGVISDDIYFENLNLPPPLVELLKKYPKQIIIGGGFLLNHLIGLNRSTDIDLFIVSKIKDNQMYVDIYKFLVEFDKLYDCYVIKSKSLLNVISNYKHTIQIIFTGHYYQHDIIYDFDIDIVQLGYTLNFPMYENFVIEKIKDRVCSIDHRLVIDKKRSIRLLKMFLKGFRLDKTWTEYFTLDRIMEEIYDSSNLEYIIKSYDPKTLKPGQKVGNTFDKFIAKNFRDIKLKRFVKKNVMDCYYYTRFKDYIKQKEINDVLINDETDFSKYIFAKNCIIYDKKTFNTVRIRIDTNNMDPNLKNKLALINNVNLLDRNYKLSYKIDMTNNLVYLNELCVEGEITQIPINITPLIQKSVETKDNKLEDLTDVVVSGPVTFRFN